MTPTQTPTQTLCLTNMVVDRLSDQIDRDCCSLIIPGLNFGDKSARKTPAMLVYVAGLDAGESLSPQTGAYQRATMTVVVFHVVAARNSHGGRGAKSINPLEVLLDSSRAALNGWRPQSADGQCAPAKQDVMTLRRGRLIDIADGRAYWSDEYQTSWRVSQVT